MQDVYTVSQGWSDFTLKAKLRRQQAGPQGQTQDAILQSCFMWETEGIQIIFWDISKVMCQQVMWLFKPQKVGIPTPWFHLSLRPLRAVNWNKASWLAAPCPEVVLGGSPPADTAAHDGVPQKALSLVSLLGTSGQEVVTQHGNSLLQVTEWPMPFLGSWKICLLCSGSNYWFIDSGGYSTRTKTVLGARPVQIASCFLRPKSRVLQSQSRWFSLLRDLAINDLKSYLRSLKKMNLYHPSKSHGHGQKQTQNLIFGGMEELISGNWVFFLQFPWDSSQGHEQAGATLV
jgi:hypothetical protein